MAEIRVARHAGFCFGVKRATDVAEKMAKEADGKQGRIYTLGRLIHNDGYVALLREKGVGELSPEEIPTICSRAEVGEKITVIGSDLVIPKGTDIPGGEMVDSEWLEKKFNIKAIKCQRVKGIFLLYFNINMSSNVNINSSGLIFVKIVSSTTFFMFKLSSTTVNL